MKIVPIASGKGGVGKTLVSSNLAISLAKEGRTVTLIDLDLGASNLHLVLNIQAKKSIGTFLKDIDSFEEIILKTEFENLYFIAGDSDIPELANIKYAQKKKIINNIRKIKSDYIILDLGAGTTFNTIDFFLISNRGIIITSPTITSTMNAYLFLKNAIFRLMHSSFKKNTKGFEILSKFNESTEKLSNIYIPKLLEKIRIEDSKSYENFMNSFLKFKPFILFNMLREPEDIKKAERVVSITKKYLSINLQSLGVFYKDELVDIALNFKIPVTIYKPKSKIAQAFKRSALKLISLENEEGLSLISDEELSQTHSIIIKEAQSDYLNRSDYLESLIINNEIDKNEIIEIINSQAQEIERLKKQNIMFKRKILEATKKGIEL